MDNDFAFAELRPSSQRLAEITTPLPDSFDQDWWAPPNHSQKTGEWSINVFSLHAALAVIQAEMREELFSVKARSRWPGHMSFAYRTIASNLAKWRRSNVLPNLDASGLLQSSYRSDIVHLVVLEASYFCTLFHLHASHILGNFTTSTDVLSSVALRALMHTGVHNCVDDAQRFLSLAALLANGIHPVTW